MGDYFDTLGDSLFGSFWNTYYGNQRVDWGALTLGYCGVSATGQTWGTNPPYTLADFAGMYPKFLGPGTAATGTIEAGTNNVAGISSVAGMAAGQLLTGAGIAGGSLIATVTAAPPAHLALTQNATLSGAVGLTVYQAPPMPLLAIQTYLNLATASLAAGLWADSWALGMALFAAHYCTLYLRSEAGPNGTAQQIAASGLERGITVSKSADGVSTSAQLVASYADWGMWGQTTYGAQLVTMAKGVAMGPIWIR